MIEKHDTTEEQIRSYYGWAEIDPDRSVVAGETGTWRIVYHVGKYGIDDGGVIKIAWRDVSDWQRPQFDDPSAPAYASVSTTGPATLKAVFDRQRYIRPWRYCVTIDVFDDSLSEGDTVTLILGDTSGGGSRAQTFCKDAFEFRVSVDWCGTWVYTEVPSPKVPIVSGAPNKLVVLGPSETTPGEATWIGVKAEDVWGNPCAEYRGTIKIDADGLDGLPETFVFEPGHRGVMRFENATAPTTGIYRVRVRDENSGFEAECNPLICIETRKDAQPFWGDLHGQSEETVGTNPVSSYFRFAREKAWMDFAGHQGNDFQITEAIWNEIKHQANTQNIAGKFVAFVGWEWSGNTPLGGDHNVYYPGDDGPLHRSSHVLIEDKSDVDTDCQHINDLYRALNGKDALLIPHVGGRYANLTWHDPNLETVVEVLSEWGEFEWFLKEALEKGYRVGFTCGSDDHKGRPGAAHPGSGAFGIYGGITCVYAKELTRESIWEAIKTRRCYGTSGQRILIDVTVGGQPMGSDLSTDKPPEIAVKVWGTAPIEKVDIFRGTEIIYTYPQTIPRQQTDIRIAWSGQRIRARNRLVRWDGSVTLNKGRIVDARGFAFDSASEGIQSADDQSVAWTSVTTGDADGVILTLDAPPDATINFGTPVLSQALKLTEIAQGPVVIDAGGIDMQVVFEQMPVGIGRDIAFTYAEHQLHPGCHPYWVRVTQIDGGKAWVSPVYVQSKKRKYNMNEYAVTFTERETAKLLPVEINTDAIGADEVAGHTLATLISAGTELNSGYLGDRFPRQSGYAAAFKVEKVGKNVVGISPGDLVFSTGNHATYQRKPVSQVIRLPDGLTPETSVFARMMGVSMTTLTTTSARPPAKILITGLGLVGHLAAKNFQACGYEVYACDPVASRRQIASETGIHNVLDSVPLENTDLSGQFQLALECSGHEQALLDAAGAVRKRAEVVCIASPWRRYTDLLIHDLHRLIFFNYVAIRSGWEWELPRQPEDFRTNSVFENFAGALKWLAEGRVNVDGIYTKYDPERCQQAYQDLLHKNTERLAVVFDWTT